MAKKSETGTEKAKQIGVNALKDLVKLTRSTKNDVSEMAGRLGEAIANAVENKHLHRKAFRAVLAEDRMEPDKLADFYDAQDYYRDILGLIDRANSAPRLSLVAGTEVEGNTAEEDLRPSNLRQPGAATPSA
jgi:hypothetical protein